MRRATTTPEAAVRAAIAQMAARIPARRVLFQLFEQLDGLESDELVSFQIHEHLGE